MKLYHVLIQGAKGYVIYHTKAEDPKTAIVQVQGTLVKAMRDWMIEAREQTKECSKGKCEQ